MLNLNLLEALEQLEEEKNISREEILQILEKALTTAYKKNFDAHDDDVEVKIDPVTGEIAVYKLIEEEAGEDGEVNVRKIRNVLNTKKFGRIAAQTAKQVLIQKLREVEKETLYQEYADLVHTIISGEVVRVGGGDVDLRINKVDAVIPAREKIPLEKFSPGQFVRGYVLEVQKRSKGPLVILSRSVPEFVQKLLEKYVPEIESGIVRIVAIAREAGGRSKVAVVSTDPNVDPVGACIGEGGSRIIQVIKELNGEKIDLIPFSSDPAQFIANALAPAKVMDVKIDEDEHRAHVTVSPAQISLAIGKDGQNARLAAKLTGWKIDIRQFMEEKD
nr:transcription termination factor NusA [Mesoaciditoga lauensis]